MTCGAFKFPGPPWYAAHCRLQGGHDGGHDFGTMEEAYAAFWAPSVNPVEQAVLAERERCAKIAEEFLLTMLEGGDVAKEIASDIRSGE